MAFTETPRAFFGDFGVDATLNAGTVRGIFLAPHGEAFGLVAGSKPSFLMDAGTAAARGDVFILGSVSYEVADIQLDGTGFQILTLEVF